MSRHGPRISHLAFADDLILFAEASVDQIDIINFVLQTLPSHVICKVFASLGEFVTLLIRNVVGLCGANRTTGGEFIP